MDEKEKKDYSFLKANILFFIFLIMGMSFKALLDKYEVPFSNIVFIFIPFMAALATCISYQSYLKTQLSQVQRRACLYNFYFISLLFKLLFLAVLVLAPVFAETGDTKYLVTLVENKLSENPVAVSFMIICFLISDFIQVFLGIIAGYLLAPKVNKKIATIKEVEFWHPTTHFVYLFALLYIGMKAILFILPEELITPYLGYVFVLLASMIVVSAYQNVYEMLDKTASILFKRHLWLASIFVDLPVLIYLGLVAKNFDKKREITATQQGFIDMYSGDFIYLAIALVIVGNYFLISLSFIFVELGKKKLIKGS
jgi:hypothetical protein